MRNEVSRRRFLRGASMAASGAFASGVLAAGAFPRIVSANKSGLGPVVVGEGAHTYEVIHDWGRVPPGLVLGNTHGVCEDAQGRIYVKHTVGVGSSPEHAVVVFDADGAFVGSWGQEFKGGAHGLHRARERSGEYLYLCDFARGACVKTSLAGEVVWRLGAPMESGVYEGPGEFKPTNVAVAPDGTLFVADGYGKSWIHVYRQRPDNAPPEYLRSFGGPGKERGQVSCPHGLMVDTRAERAHEGEPTLVVADRSNRRLQYFTLGGRSLGFVAEGLRSPCHFDERGGVLLIPDLEARVTLLDASNKVIVQLGDGTNFGLRDKPREQFVPGKFIAPHGAIFDHAGNIFVVEWVEVGRITKLRKVT